VQAVEQAVSLGVEPSISFASKPLIDFIAFGHLRQRCRRIESLRITSAFQAVTITNGNLSLTWRP
jgi:hypothetical protein